jgi:hypothetical protein
VTLELGDKLWWVQSSWSLSALFTTYFLCNL